MLVITLNVHETNLTGMSLDSKLYRLMINSRLRLDIEYSTQGKNLINQRSLHNYEVLHIDNMKSSTKMQCLPSCFVAADRIVKFFFIRLVLIVYSYSESSLLRNESGFTL